MAIGRRNQYFLIVVFLLTGLTFYYLSTREEEVQRPRMRLLKNEENVFQKGFLVHTPGCRIPEMDPYDESVRKYVAEIVFPVCNEILPLIDSNQTSIWIVAKALKGYNLSDSSELECCYAEFWRSDDDNVQVSPNCIPFNNSVNISFEFVKVECRVNSVVIYKDFHAFIVPKSKNPSRIKNETNHKSTSDSEISVLIVGADSVSRLNFYRRMPRTKNFLSYLGAVEFFGYNKVEDNTFPNLIAMLTGYSEEEISFCWPDSKSTFDECPFIWKNYSSKNYTTAFAEDSNWMGVFNYNRGGFKEPPTDYFARPFIYTSEKEIGRRKLLNAEFCIGYRYTPEVLFNYAYKFCESMTWWRKKFWALFWESSLTHDFLNSPSQTDDIFYNFFVKLLGGGVLNNTIVFFASDHGMRWGNIRTTYQGRMEEHLPFLFLLVPDWFKMRYKSAMNNIKRNTHLLTTHFDVHETMLDLLNLNSLEPEILKLRAGEVSGRRGHSLFLPGSVKRTCESAGIKPTWCTCQSKKEVQKTDPLVQKAAKITIAYLNNLLKSYKECAELKLDKIISAHVETEVDRPKPQNSSTISDYVVTFVTVPGLAKFETIVRHRSHTREMTVVSDVSRINIYGSQSKCISDYHLKLYCYCMT